jgi:DNA-binding transcriptional regulator YiaG
MEEKNSHVPRSMAPEEIKNVRLKLELSQRNFCIRYGLPLATLRNWEQGRTCPDIAASLYLYQIERCPITTAENVAEWIDKSKLVVK